MRKTIRSLLSTVALGILATACQALTVDVNVIPTLTDVDVDSINSNGGNQLTYTMSPAFNTAVGVVSTESNLTGGLQNINFLGTAGHMFNTGTYSWGAAPGVPFSYDIEITDIPYGGSSDVTLTVAAEVYNSPGTGGVTVGGSAASQTRSGGLTVEILSIDGDATLGTFNDGQVARVHSFSFGGQTITFKLREIQSPGVASDSLTAVEGRIQGAVVPEPSTLALLMGTGISSSLFLRRRANVGF